MTKYSYKTIYNVVVYSTYQVYTIFHVIHFFITFTVVKVVNVAVFLFVYRNEYLEEQKEIAYQKMIKERDLQK